MVRSWRMIVLGLMLILHGQNAIKDEVKECILCCRRKIEDDVCKNTCLELLQEHKTNETQAPLLNPGVPTFVSSEFRSIRLVWNATNRSNKSAVKYIVHVDPLWNNQGPNVIFPYVKKYYKTKKTIYTVENLLAKTKYKFRVAAVTLNETSSFSNWSHVFHTNYTCSKPPCSVTNVRLQLTLFKPYKQMTELNGTLYWEPTTGLAKLPGFIYKSYVDVNSLTQTGFCNIKFQHEFSKTGEKEKLTNKNCSSLPLINKDQKLKSDLHFGCLYGVKIGLKGWFDMKAIGNWEFYIPKCLTGVCGCEFSRTNIFGDSFVHINLTQTSKNTSSLNVIWNNENWWDAINVTYYRVILNNHNNEYEYQITLAHIDSMDHIYNYSKSFFNLTNGEKYILKITAFHNDSCTHEKMKILEFNVSYPCLHKSSCPGNSTCQRDGWLGEFKCVCLPGFRKINGICKVTYPCLNKSCPGNSTCQRDGLLGDFKCDCSPGFRKVNDSICEGVTIQFTRSTYYVYENKKPVVEIKVTSGQITSPVTIDVLYIVSTGPSSAGNDDFVPKTRNITFQPGETGPKLIAIDIVDDSIVEPPETFKISLSTSAPSVTLGKPAIVNISDNDDSSSSRNATEVTIIAIIVPVLLLLSIFVIVVLIIVRRRGISRNKRGRQEHVPASQDQPSNSVQQEIGLDNQYAELNNE